MGKIYIIGAGGHAKQIIDIVEMYGQKIGGIFDDDIQKKHTIFYHKYKVIDSISNIQKYVMSEDKIICGIGDNKVRERIYNQISNYISFDIFTNVISPLSRISQSAIIGNGNYIGHFTNISADTIMGNNNIINDSSCITHDVVIGNHNHICPGTILSGRVSIGHGNLIGTKTNINPDISISSYNIIGSSSCIVKNIVDDFNLLVGVPAKTIKKIQ